jgi:hypothetical protein
MYIDLDIKLFIRGKLTKADGTSLDDDFTAGTNNFLHSLFSQCSAILNGVTITPETELYHYQSHLETLVTNGIDAGASHLTNAYWHLDGGNMCPCDPTAADATNKVFIEMWDRQKQSKEVQLYGRIHSDISNVPQLLVPDVRLQKNIYESKDKFLLNE